MTEKTIALFPEASYGAALNCLGIAQELLKQGARPVFICHPGFHGVFAEYGFPEYRLFTEQESDDAGNIDWTKFVQQHREAFRTSAFEQIDSYIAPTWEAVVASVIRIEVPLRQLLSRLKPAAIVVDNVIAFPAVINSGIPWVRVVSCAETEITDPDIPPYLSGCASKDRADWEQFSEHYASAIAPIHERYMTFLRSCDLAPFQNDEFMETSPWLNLLLAPKILRHQRQNPLMPDKFIFLEGCVRTEVPWHAPRFASHNDKPLVYTSFGSLGAMDIELFERMIQVFATLPYRFIINVGSWREHYQTTPDNVYLDSWFPQPSVVRETQLFIHHGGNNSFCEALYFGVPSLIMPYCWDGHDNAQRAQETGVGKHLPRYEWSDEQLRATITALIDDQAMHKRLQLNAKHMQASNGAQVAAAAILHAIKE
ncbi:glycosyltransferase [Solimicrobium silvestre]|uniref:MGT: glycosyltransferase, MGT family n=1 Tax=Solimicrobium silvestre TaxID=2099400 RepID=A0A2S9GU19_9BURK|nr:glycosyltransferase [Solimicrobium silvestre]PRC91156.1 MGT: glycosyltransferase, MGT family [Solimicrobium silvestre]